MPATLGASQIPELWNDRIFLATRIQKIQGPQDSMTTIGRIHRNSKGEDPGFSTSKTVKWMDTCSKKIPTPSTSSGNKTSRLQSRRYNDSGFEVPSRTTNSANVVWISELSRT
ncbi:unnamed protein product [Caenorhabditis nigoni]